MKSNELNENNSSEETQGSSEPTPSITNTLESTPRPLTPEEQNSFMESMVNNRVFQAEAIKDMPAFLKPFARINPFSKNSLDQIKQSMNPSESKKRYVPEILTSLKHPIASFNTGFVKDGGTKNISSIASNFSVNGKFIPRGTTDEGSSKGAYRHALWQSMIAQKYGFKTATDIGNAHDKKITQPAIKNFKTLQEADTYADQLNNIIGRGIGLDNTNVSKKNLALLTLEEFRTNGLFIVDPQSDGSYTVNYRQLPEEDYQRVLSNIHELNDFGLKGK